MLAPCVASLLATLILLPAVSPAATPLPTGTEIHVNVSPLGRRFDPKATVFPDGGFVVVWANGPGGSGHEAIHARFFAADGRPTSGELRLGDPASGSQIPDQVVADRDGSFLLAWTEERAPGGVTDVFVRRFKRDGTAAGRRIQVHARSPYSRFGAHLALGLDGRFAVAWTAVNFERGASFENAMARLFAADGTLLGSPLLVLTGDPGSEDQDVVDAFPTGVALQPDGTLAVLVEDSDQELGTGTYLRRYPGMQTTLRPPLCCAEERRGGDLALTPDGGFVAAWREDSIVAERLGPAGFPRGAHFQVPLRSTGGGAQSSPRLAALPDGGFVAVWVEPQRDGDGDGIWSRVFAADGTPLTRDLRLNVTTAGNQSSPDVAANRRGPVVVVWQQEQTGIYARLFTAPRP